MKIVVRAIVLALLGGCLVSCATTVDSDAILHSRLVGTWEESRVLGMERHEQRITLGNDGRFEVFGVIYEGNKSTSFILRGKWEVKKGKFRYTSTFSEPPEALPVGESFEDTIVSVSDTEWVMLEQSTGNESRARRVR